MQIDFHHTVTYVVARWAGFEPEEAGIIAHSAQYVDNATNDGPVRFADGRLYYRLATAHKMFDPKNLSAYQNHHAWVPFHFLPGGLGTGAHRLVCVENSEIAHKMLDLCLEDCARAENRLHRLGITAHVYADTWAHRGFSGILDPVNKITKMRDRNDDVDEDFWDRLKAFFLRLNADHLPPLGHGQALAHPDLPWLVWSYAHEGKTDFHRRNNPKDFVDAADYLYRFLRRARGEPAAPLPGNLQHQLATHFEQIVGHDPITRHRTWLDLINGGAIPLIPAGEKLGYIAKGPGSWKDLALGDTADNEDPHFRPHYKPKFESSHWKRFHDAAKDHVDAVVRRILPATGLIT